MSFDKLTGKEENFFVRYYDSTGNIGQSKGLEKKEAVKTSCASTRVHCVSGVEGNAIQDPSLSSSITNVILYTPSTRIATV